MPERTMYDLIRAQKIRHIRYSERVIRIKREHVEQFMRENTYEARKEVEEKKT